MLPLIRLYRHLELIRNSGYLLRGKLHCSAVVEAIKHIQDGSHINVKIIWVISQSSHAVDGHMMYDSIPYYSCSHWPSFLNLPWKFFYLPRGKPRHSAVVEAINPFTWAPTSMPNTYKAFHNLHMLWMCIWMSPYHVTTDPVVQAFGSEIKNSGYLPRGKPQRSAVVEAINHIQDGSHINVKHIQSVIIFICCGWVYVWVLTTL
jgi:hypothetical protein